MCGCFTNALKSIAVCLLFVQVSSCTTFYFEQPLPTDRPNSNEFPAHLTGTWQSLPDTGVYMINFPDSGKISSGTNSMPFYWKPEAQQRSPFYSSNDSLSLLIEETFFAVIINGIEKIAKGAWPKLNKAREFVYPEGEVYEFEKLIVYDSLRQPVDTVDQFISRNAKMYDVDYEGTMSTGRAYWQEQDTFIMRSIDTIYFDLGKNAVLRQLNDRFYAVSFRGSVTGERNNWWQLYIIEKKADHIFSTWECSRKTKDLPSLIYLYQDHTFYFNATWTTVELMKLMADGYFIETDEYYLKQ
ncbi:hypothetical protein [Lacibacter sediminis]|uniref:Lipocalin family protein n=1 Tax=Lacibacter sediminis TaxID=2760713 RepID=A0A7G5XCF6_9BACT|nr:hypothetical protein [Lacibacter sediminis]QNA43159.1 hypothetical protein H4075_13825 [Lacibacter sediminis]